MSFQSGQHAPRSVRIGDIKLIGDCGEHIYSIYQRRFGSSGGAAGAAVRLRTALRAGLYVDLSGRRAQLRAAHQRWRAVLGFGESGQLGNGGMASSSTPVAVSGITTATAVSAGGLHNCALLASGGVQCWGSGGNGQLGNGGTVDSSTPVAVFRIGNATRVDAGESHTCARLTSSEVRCWGGNNFGQLGDGLGALSAAVPQFVGTCTLDLDGDGIVSPTTDGLLLVRALLGFSHNAVTANATGPNAQRNTWIAIKTHLQRKCGMPGLAP